ncbi:tetratricopeptide repeat protein [Thiomicrorhabdus aquaedulcis]|uniref:tetratricopeptide repeat protein n=1 Tax=Thiomicrorhabdus aquaedulcis TaxID=2211106 RepID=UPI000FD9AAAF|nr:tetratricopeptide repeat protein [Thiomicrorhabdus aquaedulcis]
MNALLRYALVSAIGSTLIMPLSALQASEANLEQRIMRLEQMASNPVMLQLTQRINEQQAEIQRLQDRVDHLVRDQQLSQETANKRYQETDERLNVLETNPARAPGSAEAGSEASGLTDEAPSKSNVVVTRESTEAEKQVYQKAFALMKAAKYKESITAFEAFIAASGDSDLAGNAAYWAGEGYFILQKYPEALAAFKKVIQSYPASPKFDDSQLRAGDTLDNLKKPAEAKAMYQGLVTTSPDSKAGQNAAKRLEKLR